MKMLLKGLVAKVGAIFCFTSFLFLAFPSPLMAAEPSMRMTFIPPDNLVRQTGGPAFWLIYLDGVIDQNTASRFSVEAERRDARDALVFLNSPGGNLAGGMALGRVIRKLGMSTYIAIQPLDEVTAQSNTPGICASACVFAYGGGVYRYETEGSRIGVHRFAHAAPGNAYPGDLDQAQITSATIVAYLREMDIDTELVSEMAITPANQINWLSKAQITRWNLANNGRQRSKWSIESTTTEPFALFLKGEQQSWVGLGKALFLCGRKGIVFYPFYEAGSNSDNITRSAVRYSIIVDEKFLPLKADGVKLVARNGFVSAAFLLPNSLAESLSIAKKIGFAAQPSGDVIYWGFNVEVGNAADASKIRGFVKTCVSKGK